MPTTTGPLSGSGWEFDVFIRVSPISGISSLHDGGNAASRKETVTALRGSLKTLEHSASN